MSENDIQRNPFSLTTTKAIEVNFKTLSSITNFDYRWEFNHRIFSIEDIKSDDDKRIFIVEFDTTINNTAKSFLLNVKFQVWFKSELPVNSEYLASPGIKINTPAIAFPFLRSFISTMSVNAGYPAIIIPSVNFVRLIADKELQSKEKTK